MSLSFNNLKESLTSFIFIIKQSLFLVTDENKVFSLPLISIKKQSFSFSQCFRPLTNALRMLRTCVTTIV
ncbi:hypothetical protein CICLE_v10017395mg [Citrus x clementina]|uniref:Uncharacterized protein n=1 Tax=Citrus clementina TaxID=85681 RepID=V4W0X9_CITCL|nr:hypothetical protein CICLE_v10017395mg [Citrus x clementina]